MKLLGIEINDLKKMHVDYMATQIMLISAFDIVSLDMLQLIKSNTYIILDEYIKKNKLTSEQKEIISNIKTRIKKY